ncbi:hypothetical protein CTI12_AA081760 [Artemisia annua]|uniref:Uncharacterized protein n=1 Tax=Artemisia annua TaxID=35608 RepID=A0A2U1LRM5_ARTAN|nr:hypothetical protein CTI12_AA463390 [Artemisia annua]PWA92146.1 hypothetical protein CTI12_AA081760 [Artemisia annua]
MRSKSMSHKNLLMRIITTPFRVLGKAKDFYVRSITDCSNGATYGMASMSSTQNPLSRSSSTSSYYSNASEDLRELIRANSTASMRDVNISRSDLDMCIKQHMMNKQSSSLPVMGSKRVPRSVSVGMARIDEDAPVSSFRDDEELGRKAKSDHMMFPRSKSHAVSSSAKINRYS